MDTKFLKESGWTFCIIGAIAVIVGLIAGVSGIWITGFGAIACGVYLMIKAKQALEEAAKETPKVLNSPTAGSDVKK